MRTGCADIDKITNEFGIEVDDAGEVIVEGCRLTDLARSHGTPLHVVNLDRLGQNCQDFLESFHKGYNGKVSVHYAFKCNPVAGIIREIRGTGIRAEVMSEFELSLALKLGFKTEDIIVNGPCKTENLIKECFHLGVRHLVIDSLDELEKIRKLAKNAGQVRILLRINPDYVPRGMNSGSATGSRNHCALGLDIRSDEVMKAIQFIKKSYCFVFEGFHFHIGTGIKRPEEYRRAILKMNPLIQLARESGLCVSKIDIGGGFASASSKEMTSIDMFYYHMLNRLPKQMNLDHRPRFSEFASVINRGILETFEGAEMPELILEPGRCLISNSQLLLIMVHQVKKRARVGKWITTDGGIGTVSMPTYYEFHKVLLCNNIHRPSSEYVTLNGPGCFAADVVYKNIFMPELRAGEILAIMDSGAYFTSWESNFGFPRPAVVALKNGAIDLIRRRETFDDMINRDKINQIDNCIKENDPE